MRKIVLSSKEPSSVRLRACAEVRSLPKGFSTMTRAPWVQPDRASRSTTSPKSLGGAELLANGLEGRRVLVVAVHVTQHAAQRVERRGIESAVLLDAVARAGAELVDPPAGLGHADHRHVEVAAFRHRLQR